MEKVWRFAKRHRGKLIVAGVVSAVSAGGLYLVKDLSITNILCRIKIIDNCNLCKLVIVPLVNLLQCCSKTIVF